MVITIVCVYMPCPSITSLADMRRSVTAHAAYIRLCYRRSGLPVQMLRYMSRLLLTL